MLVRRNNSLRHFNQLNGIFLRVNYCSNESEKPRCSNVINDFKVSAKSDIERLKHLLRDPKRNSFIRKSPTVYADVLIIGGGAIGSSIAYWLKERTRDAISVVVVEKDSTYHQASTTLSLGGIRQQYSIKENILLSLYGAEFLRNVDKYLQVPGEDTPDVSFCPNGYLVLASATGVEQLKENYELQKQLGCKHELLTPCQMNERFPWLNTKDIELGCLGVRDEGWFDPTSLLMAFRKKATVLGAEYINGEVIKFIMKPKPCVMVEGYEPGKYVGTNHVEIRQRNGEIRKMEFGIGIIATGAETGKFASELLNIKKGNEGCLGLEIPIERRKRYIFCFEAPDGPDFGTPLVVDPSGVHFRRERTTSTYVVGGSPSFASEPETNDLTVDGDYFNDYIWPALAERVPAFEQIRMKSSWAGFYDYNTFDQNLILGNHPAYYNIHIASGCSGHGIQHAAAIGKSMMEYLIEDRFSIVDMKLFSFDRIIAGAMSLMMDGSNRWFFKNVEEMNLNRNYFYGIKATPLYLQ